MFMKALITGSNGFSGRHLADFLASRQVTVFGFKGDVNDANNVLSQLTKVKPDWIFHLASPLLRTDRLIDDSLIINLETDLFGSLNLLRAAATLKLKPRILITGTNAQYAPKNSPIKETDRLGPVTAYGLSKLTQELVCRQIALGYNLPLIQTRTFHLVGPGQKAGFVIPDLISQIGTGKVVIGNGKIERDYTDVRDAVRAYFLLMKKGKPGEVYNVCSGKTISIGDIIDKLISFSGKKVPVTQKSSWRQNDPKFICGDRSKLAQTTGWQPEIDIDTSLKDVLKANRS